MTPYSSFWIARIFTKTNMADRRSRERRVCGCDMRARRLVRAAVVFVGCVAVADGFVAPSNSMVGRSWNGVRRRQAAKPSLGRLAMSEVQEAWTMISQANVLSDDSLKYFMSGGLAGSISHGWTVPIDVVKTRLQTDDRLRKSGFVQAAASILKHEGLPGLSVGLGSTVIGYALKGSLKYGIYEFIKPFCLAAAASGGELSAFLLAAAVAELFASIALCPLEATRIRLVSDPSFGSEVFDALPRLVREEGMGVFAGLPAVWLRQVPYTMVQLSLFDALRDHGGGLLRAAALDGDGAARFALTVASAGVAGVFSSLASQPGDVILSEVSSGRSRYGAGVASVVRGMAAAAPRDFFRGTRARLVHVLSIVVSQLVVYDGLKGLLGIAGAAH